MGGGVAVVDMCGQWNRASGRWLKKAAEACHEWPVVLADGKGLAITGGADDEVVAAEIKVGEPPYAPEYHELTEFTKVLQPASHDLAVELLPPFFSTVRGVYGGVREHVVQLEDNLFGTAADEPIMHYHDTKSG